MRICGLQKLSMVDFPGLLAATVFTGGCNLRCPFCHNALLVTRLNESPVLPEEEILHFLRSRRGLLDGVVLSGGEPLMQPGAAEFLAKVKDLGFQVKLDTNGCYPDVLGDILRRGLTDYVAMDIKNSPAKYARTAGCEAFDLAAVNTSITLLQESGIAYEFRTTVVQELHEDKDFIQIGQWLQKSPRYFLQKYEDSGNLIKGGFTSPTDSQMKHFAEIALPYFDSVGLRGVE